jgi:hypothetical protein
MEMIGFKLKNHGCRWINGILKVRLKVGIIIDQD